MAFHAKLSPSSAKRWMNCPGSVALIGDESSATNAAAMKGTAAHKVIEMMILGGCHDAREYAGWNMLVYGGQEHIEEHCEAYAPGVPALNPNKPRPDWHLFIVDEKMVESVQTTIDAVDRFADEMFQPEIYAERFLDMTWLDPRFGGTADVTLVEPFGWAHLVDHKNGFILVEHEDNEQLKNYAVGVMHEHPDCEGVRVTISQPNAPHIEGAVRTAEFTRAELVEFAAEMKRAAEETTMPNAPRRPGEWCVFCPAKTRCKEHEDMVREEAISEFADDLTLDDEPPTEGTEKAIVYRDNVELARKARWVPIIESWCKQVKSNILAELMADHPVPGWKLVHAKSNRAWPGEYTEKAVVKQFTDIGVPEEELLTTPKLKSPAKIEKLGTGRAQRKLVKAKVAELAFKPKGKITVALDTDPRESTTAFGDALSDFDEPDADDEDFGP